jgi:hypothetical protein
VCARDMGEDGLQAAPRVLGGIMHCARGLFIIRLSISWPRTEGLAGPCDGLEGGLLRQLPSLSLLLRGEEAAAPKPPDRGLPWAPRITGLREALSGRLEGLLGGESLTLTVIGPGAGRLAGLPGGLRQLPSSLVFPPRFAPWTMSERSKLFPLGRLPRSGRSKLLPLGRLPSPPLLLPRCQLEFPGLGSGAVILQASSKGVRSISQMAANVQQKAMRVQYVIHW